MGYSGASWMIQEICTRCSTCSSRSCQSQRTRRHRGHRNPPRGEMPWAEAAQDALDRRISNEPVLVRISAAKRLRDAAEREARRENAAEVAIRHVDGAARLAGAYA